MSDRVPERVPERAPRPAGPDRHADPGTVDLARHLRPGDVVTWGQACAEPLTLTRLLIAQADRLGPIRCVVGIPAVSALTVDTLPPRFTVASYCGTGTNAALYDAGRLEILPVHYSQLPELLTRGAWRADVVLVQVSPPDEHGRYRLGLADDYFSAALHTARVVIAEVNDAVPDTLGARVITADDVTTFVRATVPPAEFPPATVSSRTRAVARRVAALVEDEATLQFGIGALPGAVLDELHDRRGLGIHSGLLNDEALELVEAGVATGEHKSSDRGVAIGGLATGGHRLFTALHRNPRLQLRSTRYTHDPEILAGARRLTAINAAIEVDLTGQVNAEVAAGRYVGAVGGSIDFLRGAARSRGGLPIVALPSTSRGVSRIVRRPSGPVSTPRAEQLVIVTEHGVADLRGRTVSERVAAMIAIADPAHRAELDADADRVLAEAGQNAWHRRPS